MCDTQCVLCIVYCVAIALRGQRQSIVGSACPEQGHFAQTASATGDEAKPTRLVLFGYVCVSTEIRYRQYIERERKPF